MTIDSSLNITYFGKEAFPVMQMIFKKHWGIKESKLPKPLLYCGPEPADEITFWSNNRF